MHSIVSFYNHRLPVDFKYALLFILFCVPSAQLISHGRRDLEIDGDLDEAVEISAGSSKPTREREDIELREILCPGSNEKSGGLLRYDLRAGRCAEIDTQGHCGRNMIFKEDIDSSAYGYCECDFQSHSVPLVYHLQTHTCYPIYQQGYCKNGEWLVLSQKAKGPVCERQQCISNKQSSRGQERRSKVLFPEIWENESDTGVRNELLKNTETMKMKIIVPLNGNGQCVELGTQSQFCGPNEKVLIAADDIYPRCNINGKSARRLSIIPNACPPGSYYSIIGYCQPVWDF